ncbi:MAG: gliding motility-associated C-terminal domain-containing protein, partial [Tunicatimonas sp.]|uniref:T9SS type B sorting domain-containing protein n=1 Tax=Tunicatimonas sp. TaxID=1940096 RepID=UPI003C766023
PEPNDPTQIIITQEYPSSLLATDTVVCANEPFLLTTTSAIAQPFYWTGPDDYYSEENQPETILASYDSAYYYLHRQVAGCEVVDSILVQTLPVPAVVLAADTTIRVGTSVELAPSTEASSSLIYRWTPVEGLSCADCINPVATPLESVTYQLTVENQLGCTRTASVSLEVIENEPVPEVPEVPEKVRIPNAFSPNDDGLNDVFFPVVQPGVECQKLEIYNRWGELIFQQLDFPPNQEEYGWKGFYQGRRLDPGTYTYRLLAKDQQGEQLTYSGRIRLIR